MIEPSARWESILDKPGGKGPTGRRKHKDDDGTLVARITARTGERFTSRSEKIAAESWTVRSLQSTRTANWAASKDSRWPNRCIGRLYSTSSRWSTSAGHASDEFVGLSPYKSTLRVSRTG